MPLSPHEQKVLATLEEELRADDPALADALAAPPASSAPSPAALGLRQVLQLVAALLALIAVGTFFASRPAVLVLVTGLLLVPWTIAAARSAARRSGPERRYGWNR